MKKKKTKVQENLRFSALGASMPKHVLASTLDVISEAKMLGHLNSYMFRDFYPLFNPE